MMIQTSYSDFRSGVFYQLGSRIENTSGFSLATTPGLWQSLDDLATRDLSQTGFSVLYSHPDDRPTKRRFGLNSKKPRRRLIATVWVNNTPRQASQHSWVVELFGTETQETAESLLTRIAGELNPRITISFNLIQAETRYETYLRDYDL